MKRIVMTLEQIQAMVAKEEGFDSVKEFIQTMEESEYYNPYSIYWLIGESVQMGFCRDGVTRWYMFEDYKGRPCIYFKH